MKSLLAFVAVLFALAVAIADSPRGLKPRATAASYPAFQQHQALSLGAEQLSKKQVQHAFATELEGRYIVIEVGLFPAANANLKVSTNDFMLRVAGTNQVLRPASPETIAQVLYKKPATSRDVTIMPTGGVGYETGGGITTSAGAGVGIGKTKVGATEGDRKTMETELRDKSLQQGEATQPVSGYLYFPVSTGKKVQYELEYSGNGQSIRLQLPAPKE